MDKHLLAISIGPVQDFIASARRTRDLWFGSHVLSEISKAAAKALYDVDVELVFPAPLKAQELEPYSRLSVANKILAVLPGGEVPERVIMLAKQAVQLRWRDFADAALSRLNQDLASIVDQTLWDEQVADVIEFYAAWAAWPQSSSYGAVRERVERILSGRKGLRDFDPGSGRPGVPKSSLDGARESVLRRDHGCLLRLGIRVGEQLDAVGMIKRLAGEADHYPSIVQVAANPWIRYVTREAGNGETAGAWKRVLDFCQSEEVVHRFDDRLVLYRDFPYDATALYASRLPSLVKDRLGETERVDKLALEMMDCLKRLQCGQPSPYMAVLLADGDRMGATISRIQDEGEHRQFSRELSRFAGKAREVVERHSGVLVYSGGDDVLAFVPIDKCLEAASELHREFGELLKPFADENGRAPTLSVGVAIGHCMEPLEDLINLGRDAEKEAKGTERERDGLAVLCQTRSGGDTVRIRAQWDSDPVARLQKWISRFGHQEIPSRLAYDIRRLAVEYKRWQGTIPAELLKREVGRLLEKKRIDGKYQAELLAEDFHVIHTAQDLLHFGNELILARWLAQESSFGAEKGKGAR